MAGLRSRMLLVVLVSSSAGVAMSVPARAAVAPQLYISRTTTASLVQGVEGCPYKSVREQTDGRVSLRLSTAQPTPVVVEYALSGATAAWKVTPATGTAIPAGKTTLDVTFHPRPGWDPLTITIVAGGGYTIGSPEHTVMTQTSIAVDPPICPQRGISGWPHSVGAGFSTSTGSGFMLAFGDGVLNGYGDFPAQFDASRIDLAAPIVGGTIAAGDSGYWLVARDGGVFSFGARFFGSMGATPLNRPVFSMAATKTGLGYWLAARDGGIFSFGDAHFYGSAGSMHLNQPIVAIARSRSGRGYRLVARDGGIFSFGDAHFYGSLPGLGIAAADVVGMAPTPSGRGYWIARAGGHVYSFGDAPDLGKYQVGCDPLVAIFSNPHAQGYRIVTRSGATIAFGDAPAGTTATGHPKPCSDPVG